jgi:predicted nucleic acid-binding protein
MLIESDMFIAYLKREDWLKESASRIFKALAEGSLKGVQASSEVFHEIYYVFSDYTSLDVIIGNIAWMAAFENITYVDATREIYLSALDLMNSYGVSSIFDAVYAATALTERVPDHTIVSTDKVYDRISGVKRVDPREFKI